MAQKKSGSNPVQRRATLKDIAKSLDLDVSTVSKVLNGSSITVRPDTRKRILAEASRLQYQPNASARGLRLNRTGALGLLISDLTNPVYAQVARGAVQQAEANGYAMFVAEMDTDNLGPSYGKMVLESRIDGLIVATARDTSTFLEDLERSGTPYVFANRRVEGSNRSVYVDDERGGAMAAEVLIEAGHSDLAIISGPPSIDTARRRRSGFAARCEAAGLPVIIATGPYTLAGGQRTMDDLLRATKRPTGVFASNMLSGLGALSAVQKAGLRVPDDISLVTFDGDIAAYVTPALTAIKMPLWQMGARAVTELERLIKHGEATDSLVDVEPTLAWRDSVAPPPSRSG